MDSSLNHPYTMPAINYFIPISNDPITGFKRKYEWRAFQFRKDTKSAMLMGVTHYYHDVNGEYGEEINQSPIMPQERNTHTVEGRDFINKTNGAYCSKSIIDNPAFADDNTLPPKIDKYIEVISGNDVVPSNIISQFDYFENLLGSGTNILQIIPVIVSDLNARGIID